MTLYKFIGRFKYFSKEVLAVEGQPLTEEPLVALGLALVPSPAAAVRRRVSSAASRATSCMPRSPSTTKTRSRFSFAAPVNWIRR